MSADPQVIDTLGTQAGEAWEGMMNQDERLSLAEAQIAFDEAQETCPLCLGRYGCRACDNKGNVGKEQAERIRQGIQRRYTRMGKGMTALQESQRLGISLAELIDMELGLVPGEQER